MRSLLFTHRLRHGTDATPGTELAAEQPMESTQAFTAPASSQPSHAQSLISPLAAAPAAAPNLLEAAAPSSQALSGSANAGNLGAGTPLINQAASPNATGIGSINPGAPQGQGPVAVGSDGKVQILVQFKAGIQASEMDQAIKGIGATFVETVRAHDQDHGDLISISVSAQAADAVIAALSHNSNVSFAEYNWSVFSQLVSSDTYYSNGSLWGMYGDATSPSKPYGSQADEAWIKGFAGSQKVVIGDIDTGIDYTHKDLYLNVWLNQKEIPFAIGGAGLQDVNGDGLITFVDLNDIRNSKFVTDINKNGYIDAGDLLNDIRWENRIDEDRNGYTDDLIGWDFVNNDNDPYDDNNHGTHTAGTIGALANTGGVIGVAPNVQIMALKFLSASGSGSISNAVKAEDYYTAIAKNASSNLNFVATSNSWGGGGFSQAMLDAIVRAALADILFVAAAGNGGSDGIGDNNNTTANYPSNYSTANSTANGGAGYEAVIAVAALGSSGSLASFSNYGSTTVDLAAPGVGVWSTVAGGGYASYSGTSMATPHVSGALAVLAAAFPNASAADLRDALLASVIKISNLAVASGGTLDVNQAITQLSAELANTPVISLAIDSGVIAEGGSGSKTISFTLTLTSAATSMGDVTVDWSINHLTTNVSDVPVQTGLVIFTNSARTQTFSVTIYGDATPEANEQFTLTLTGGAGAAGAVFAENTAIVTINNDDNDAISYASTTNASLTLGTPTAGVIDYATDLDAFKVTLSAGKTYCFDLTPNGSSLDPQLTLLDRNFAKIIASNDDLTASGSLDARIIYTVASNAGGTYYLTAGAAAGTSGGYSIKATPALVGTDNGNSITGTSSAEVIIGKKGADTMTGGGSADTFVFAAGDSGQASGFDVITDFIKSQDIIDYQVAMTIGGTSETASSTQASVNQTTGVATFASSSGTTLSDALSDIATSFTAAGDAAGKFALFQVNNTGNFYLFISDGAAGVTTSDVVVQLGTLTSVGSIALTNGNLVIA